MKDFGYDISNYKEIDPTFGTMEDFEHLVTEMHSRGKYTKAYFIKKIKLFNYLLSVKISYQNLSFFIKDS